MTSNSNSDNRVLKPMGAPLSSGKKRGRPRKSEPDCVVPRKSVRQAEKNQLKSECEVSKVTEDSARVCLDSEEDDWSFDEEDEDYLATMFKKLNNSGAKAEEEEEEEEEDEEEEEEDEEGAEVEDNRDVYDFDQQSSVMSQQGASRATRRWLSLQQRQRGCQAVPGGGEGGWGSNIYSHAASLLNTRQDLDMYSRFLKCSHANRLLDTTLAELCKPFRVAASEGSCASMRSLKVSPEHIVALVREVVSERFDNAAHRISHFVVLVKQPIGGLRYCSGSTDTRLHFTDILHCIDPRMVGDAAFIAEADRTDLRRVVPDVDTVVVSDTFYSLVCDTLLSSSSPHLQRVVVGVDENKAIFGMFVLDYWNRAGVPYNRPRKYTTPAAAAAAVQSGTEHSSMHCNSAPTDNNTTTMEFVDAFFVRMGGKKGAVHMVTKLHDSRFTVYNVMSEYSFAFKKHGLSPESPIVLEGMYSTFPEVLGEEKSLLVVPDLLYRSLSKTMSKEVQSTSCKFKKCVLLDKRTRLPLGLFFDTEVSMDLQVDDKLLSHQSPLSILSQTTLSKPTTQNVQLVSLNGLLVGLESSSASSKSVTKCYELLSDSAAILKPQLDRRQSIQTTYFSQQGASTIVQLSNLETRENTFLSASLYDNVPYCKRQDQIEHFLNDIADSIFDLTVKVSLFDSLFRLHQRSGEEIVNDVHNTSAASAAPGGATGKCVFCQRDFRVASLYDHEARHLGLVKFKCHKHQMFFGDMKSYRGHRDEYLNCDSGLSDNETEVETLKLLNISASITDCPQCQKCFDYFPQSDLLNRHLDLCDGVSFHSRTPLEESATAAATASLTAAMDNGGGVGVGGSELSTAIICGICGLSYPKMDTLCSHMNTHLTCNICRTRLASIDELSAHIGDHVARKDTVSGRGIRKIFSCDICNDFYGTKINYYYHQWHEHGVVHPPIKAEQQQQHQLEQQLESAGRRRERKSGAAGNDQLSYNATGLKKFRCKFCQTEVKVSGRTYLKHLDTKHGLTVDGDCVCRICAEVFDTSERLSEHLRARHIKSGEYVNAGVQSIFSCDKCTFFGHYNGVVSHSKTVHCEPSPCLYECPHCPERMVDRRLWRLHLERFHEEVTHTHGCMDCGIQFKNPGELEVHMDAFHGGGGVSLELIAASGDVSAPFECPVCQERFMFENQLSSHRDSVHSTVLLLQCDLCSKTCKTSKAYELHRMKHFRTKIFQCTECQSTFRSKLAMRRHIRVDHLHLEPERYECQICGKIVTQISMHMLIHKNARYECEFCERRFTKSAYYNEHVRIHRGEKPYECHICQRRFNKKSNLNVHISFHEKHRDDYGNYLEIKPRGRGHPDYDPEKTRARKTAMIRHEVQSGPDFPGSCVHDDWQYKMENVLSNSKFSDTSDLGHYMELLDTLEQLQQH